ncbi:unnamed protein product [Albugo candida]|uniref:Uncharacterized protein n=1 Tax=Albugo candida TaxID=65357 RepID=A0A024FZ79_9STRA|nr:unnamed protein product [Albugo candida]|eukprot:CCI39355.1 unnamed protein product [Albugo candida]
MTKNPLEDALAAALSTLQPESGRKVHRKEMKSKTKNAQAETNKQPSITAPTRRKRNFREFVRDEIDSEVALPKLVWKNQKLKRTQGQNLSKQPPGIKRTKNEEANTLKKSTKSSGLLKPPSVTSIAKMKDGTIAGTKIEVTSAKNAQIGANRNNRSGVCAVIADHGKTSLDAHSDRKHVTLDKQCDSAALKVVPTGIEASRNKKKKGKNRKCVMKSNLESSLGEKNESDLANRAMAECKFTKARELVDKSIDKIHDQDQSISDKETVPASGLEAALHQVDGNDFISVNDKSKDEKQCPTLQDTVEMHDVFSKLIDQAARDQWELQDVGRLVRLFASTWDLDGEKTAAFVLQHCPELVNLDFLEGLNLKLRNADIFNILDHGSGNLNVLLNKTTSLIENHVVKISDPAFLFFLNNILIPRGVEEFQNSDSVAESIELSHQNGIINTLSQIMESCTHVRDVGVLLQSVCKDWPSDHIVSLVQALLLSSVFDDLEGSDRELLAFLPRGIEARLEFPNRIDDEDADENGNLKDWIVDDEDGEIDTKRNNTSSGSDNDKDDSDSNSAVQSGDSDSDDEKASAGWNRQRGIASSRFVLDEAEEGDESEDEDDTSKEISDDD